MVDRPLYWFEDVMSYGLTTTAEGNEPAFCEAFARCTNQAVRIRDCGPVGLKPACAKCDDKLTRLEDDNA